MGTLHAIGADHEIRPAEDTASRTKPGFRAAPADLANPAHYPAEAICGGCRMIIRAESLGAGWAHTGRAPGE